jgi:hypothetical protein
VNNAGRPCQYQQTESNPTSHMRQVSSAHDAPR